MSNDYSAQPDELDRDLVFRFFWTFSVFECALKREGFLKLRPDDRAEPDWRRFGTFIVGRFDDVQAEGFQEAVGTLMEASPRRQVVSNNRLAWADVVKGKHEPDEQFVIRLVKTVRNNLFHGGKYPDGPIPEVARDREILRAALKVLEGFRELHPGIARWVASAA